MINLQVSEEGSEDELDYNNNANVLNNSGSLRGMIPPARQSCEVDDDLVDDSLSSSFDETFLLRSSRRVGNETKSTRVLLSPTRRN